jgi:putative flippase GtrA
LGRRAVSRVPFARRRLALMRRFTGYSAGSAIAALTSEAAFLATLGWGHAGTTWASGAGFVGGAVPNYVLNRRWAWKTDHRGRSRSAEVILYMTVALASFVSAAVATHWTEALAKQLTTSDASRILLAGTAYLAVSALFFVAKFILYEKVVFVPGRRSSAEDAGAEDAGAEDAGAEDASAEDAGSPYESDVGVGPVATPVAPTGAGLPLATGARRLAAHQVPTTTRANRSP